MNKKEMIVLYDHQVTSLQDVGGVSRYHFELARHLSSNTEIQAAMYLGLNRSLNCYSLLKNSGVRVFAASSPIGPGRLRYAINEVVTSGFLLGRKWDIYHPTRHRRMPSVRARKMVITNHDCAQERFPELFPHADRVIRFRAQSFHEADLIICVSRSSQEDLLRFHGIRESKTRVIHHGISPLPMPAQTKRTSRPYLLYVGGRPAYKNCAALLQAFAESRLPFDFDLLLLGGGALSNKEQEHVAKLGISKAVRQQNAVSDAELSQVYAEASLFIYPSLYEGFGFPPLEAMSLGCIVLAARTSSIPEICREVPYYFDPGDISSLSTMMTQALNAADHHERIAAGRKLAQSYRWSDCASRTLDAYREVTN